MVKIIKGSYGHRKGKVIVPVYAGETVELTPEQEVRLVKLGVAEVVNPNGKTSGGKPPKAPEGNSDNDEQSDALPEYDEKMKLVELKEIDEKYGVDASAMQSKKEVIAAIDAAKKELPTFDGADDVVE